MNHKAYNPIVAFAFCRPILHDRSQGGEIGAGPRRIIATTIRSSAKRPPRVQGETRLSLVAPARRRFNQAKSRESAPVPAPYIVADWRDLDNVEAI
jgi:hypothetical protein